MLKWYPELNSPRVYVQFPANRSRHLLAMQLVDAPGPLGAVLLGENGQCLSEHSSCESVIVFSPIWPSFNYMITVAGSLLAETSSFITSIHFIHYIYHAIWYYLFHKSLLSYNVIAPRLVYPHHTPNQDEQKSAFGGLGYPRLSVAKNGTKTVILTWFDRWKSWFHQLKFRLRIF